MTNPESQSNSVQSLIDRIRDQGIGAAREEAARIVKEAEDKAEKMLADARAEIDRMHAECDREHEAEMLAGQEALRLSARDAVLHLKAQVSSEFERFVKRLVSSATADEDLVRSLVLVLAGQAVDEVIKDRDIQILISSSILKGEAEESLRERGRQNILALSTEMLRDGVELIPANGLHGGARVRLVGEQLEIDLSDVAITHLLCQTMLPRFRRILEGIE